MTAPTTLVWELAGRREPVASMQALIKPISGICAVSGDEVTLSADVNRALGANFTDRSMFRAPQSSRVGAGALWCCSGKGLSTLRLWSIIAAPGEDLPASHEKAFVSEPGLWLGNRADPRPIARILGDPPAGEWLVTIAVSGQKHVLPYGTVNRGRGRWVVRMENTEVTATPTDWLMVHRAAVALRKLGVSADNVFNGQPGFIRDRSQLTEWVALASPLAPYVQSPLLQLALWVITKGTLDD